jgi:hypothetical protein
MVMGSVPSVDASPHLIIQHRFPHALPQQLLTYVRAARRGDA